MSTPTTIQVAPGVTVQAHFPTSDTSDPVSLFTHLPLDTFRDSVDPSFSYYKPSIFQEVFVPITSTPLICANPDWPAFSSLEESIARIRALYPTPPGLTYIITASDLVHFPHSKRPSLRINHYGSRNPTTELVGVLCSPILNTRDPDLARELVSKFTRIPTLVVPPDFSNSSFYIQAQRDKETGLQVLARDPHWESRRAKVKLAKLIVPDPTTYFPSWVGPCLASLFTYLQSLLPTRSLSAIYANQARYSHFQPESEETTLATLERLDTFNCTFYTPDVPLVNGKIHPKSNVLAAAQAAQSTTISRVWYNLRDLHSPISEIPGGPARSALIWFRRRHRSDWVYALTVLYSLKPLYPSNSSYTTHLLHFLHKEFHTLRLPLPKPLSFPIHHPWENKDTSS